MDDQIETHARALCQLAEAEQLTVRLFGSCAIRIKCGDNAEIFDRCERQPKDIDCVIPNRDVKGLRSLLKANAWREDVELTAQTDGNRLRFTHRDHKIVLDVSVDVLHFAQKLDVTERLPLDKPTLPAADLLLSKLQIRELTAADVIDVVGLLYSVPLGDDPSHELEVGRLIQITTLSWRWYKAVQSAFTVIATTLKTPLCGLDPSARALVGSRITLIEHEIARAPKGFLWKARAKFGDMLPWYDNVEVSSVGGSFVL